MIGILFILGIAIIVIGFIMGIILGTSSGSFLAFLVTVVTSAVSSAIFFALAKILEKQEEILYRLKNLPQQMQKPPAERECSKCGKSYDAEMTSCPACGFKSTQ
jgi:uncharacterized protein YacL